MKNTVFPSREVILDGTKYYIHGLVHGTAFTNLSPLLKKEINSHLKGYNIICEDGFSPWIEGSQSMGEIAYFGLNKISFTDFFRFWFSMLPSNSEKLERDKEIVFNIQRMNSIEDLNEIRDRLFKEYLPEPEGMNYILKRHECGTLSSPKGKIPLKIRRYIYEAKFSLDYANKNNLKDLHIVVGCAHERPLEYLLKNSFILDNYTL